VGDGDDARQTANGSPLYSAKTPSIRTTFERQSKGPLYSIPTALPFCCATG
ncbi:5668_t:CDS:1, partial [Acaulospora colombiana]